MPKVSQKGTMTQRKIQKKIQGWLSKSRRVSRATLRWRKKHCRKTRPRSTSWETQLKPMARISSELALRMLPRGRPQRRFPRERGQFQIRIQFGSQTTTKTSLWQQKASHLVRSASSRITMGPIRAASPITCSWTKRGRSRSQSWACSPIMARNQFKTNKMFIWIKQINLQSKAGTWATSPSSLHSSESLTTRTKYTIIITT